MPLETTPSNMRDLSKADAASELFIVGTVKTVGDTSIDANAAASTVVTDGNSAITGLIAAMNPKTTVDAVTGLPFAVDVGGVDTAYVQGVAERELTIGKVVDSAEDMARLMIVTQYAGTKMARVYSLGDVINVDETQTGTKAGYISIDVMATEDDVETNNVALKSEGTWYRAGMGTDGMLAEDDDVATGTNDVATGTKGVEVFFLPRSQRHR